MRITSPIVVGVVAGLLFFGHAMINNSHAWPLIWPALAGAAAVLMAHRARMPGYGADLAAAGVAGASAAVIFFGATAVCLSGLGMLRSESFAGLALAAVLGLVAALIVGGLTHPIAARRA